MRKVSARWFHRGRLSPVRLIVIHTMEWAERPSTAEDCAQMFKTMGRQASAHVCVDNNSAVRCVGDGDTAWAAPGANADGLQLELAGFARQTRKDWSDDYSQGVLEQAAKVCAEWAGKYRIPVRKLSRAELKAGKKGFTTHADVSAVYKRSDHGDPGVNFPWEHFLRRVKHYLAGGEEGGEEAVEAPAWPGRKLVSGAGGTMVGEDVQAWQRQMRARGWDIKVDGVYGERSRLVAKAFQRDKGLKVTGVVDEKTWVASWRSPIT